MAEVPVKQVVQDLLNRVNSIETGDENFTQEIADLTSSLQSVVNNLTNIETDLSSIKNDITTINNTLDDYHDLLYMEVD